ncbi:MAG: hypothetical protein ABSF55_01225, partial [Candidatus Staskawiczbacteria bacterium]
REPTLISQEYPIVIRLLRDIFSEEFDTIYVDKKIDKKEILTKESIVAGQNGPNFKEVYQGLELQDSRYMRVDLMNQAGDKGLITVIDFKNQTVPKAYGIVLLNINGQTASPTKN